MNALPNPFEFESVALPTTDEPVAAWQPPADAVAGSPIPAGYVLVERELLGRVVKRLRQASERDREELRERMVTLLERVMQ